MRIVIYAPKHCCAQVELSTASSIICANTTLELKKFFYKRLQKYIKVLSGRFWSWISKDMKLYEGLAHSHGGKFKGKISNGHML